MPTILAVAGVPSPKGLEGENLAQIAEGDARVILTEAFPNSHFFELSPRFRRIERAAVSGTRKLIFSTAGKRETYDLASDPGEARNLYRTDPRGRELEAHLNLWLKTSVRERSAASTVDRGALDRLKSLGYVQ
jgi:arylsulfatase A-like enzyme